MSAHQSLACHELVILEPLPSPGARFWRSHAGKLAASLLSRVVAAAGLALMASIGPAAATELRDPAQIEDHAQSTVALFLLHLGVEGTSFHAISSASLPQQDGPAGMAVCGTVEDLDEADLGFHFILFYSRNIQGGAALAGAPLLVRAGAPGSATAAELCEAAAETAWARGGQHAVGLRP